MVLRRPLATLALLLMTALPVGGQTASTATADPPASLVADSVVINPDNTLVASGAVEVFYKGSRMTARRISFDQTSNRLKIEGPITIDDGKGTVVLASEAELTTDFRDGVLKSARLVLQDKMQLAAAQMDRVEGRYTQLSRVVASSCQVCPSNPKPLWEIRASRVVHDQTARQLYFDNAQFRVAGIPVFWAPQLRMPDPTLDRATGFLLPGIRASSTLGFGVSLPYFIAIGDSRDLTLTPYYTDKGYGTLNARYRQAFRNGTLSFTGAIGQDKVLNRDWRGYLFGYGTFTLPRNYRLGFQIETVSDDGYLVDYSITDKDRLSTGTYIQRTSRDSYFDARIFKYRSLRQGDVNDILPTLVGNISYIRRVTPAVIGGQGTLTFDFESLQRTSSLNYDANGDGTTDGRDMARITLGATWRGQTVFGPGLVLGGGGGLSGDLFLIGQDASYASTVTRVTPMATADLRWPLMRTSARTGITDVIEPVVQLVWSHESNKRVPNEDSTTFEFDEGNLFSFSRFSGYDIYETGLRANLGLSWTRQAPEGWSFTVLGGRILREKDLGQFSTGSSLSGTRSDWLLATRLQSADGVAVTNRALFDDNFTFSKDELRLDWSTNKTSLGANYIWLAPDISGGRPVDTSEFSFDAGYQMATNWRALATARYDFQADRAARAGLGLQYRNECAAVDFSLSRRFTSSTSVTPTTEFSVAVRLNGFGTGSDGRTYRKSCGG